MQHAKEGGRQEAKLSSAFLYFVGNDVYIFRYGWVHFHNQVDCLHSSSSSFLKFNLRFKKIKCLSPVKVPIGPHTVVSCRFFFSSSALLCVLCRPLARWPSLALWLKEREKNKNQRNKRHNKK